MTSEEIRSWRQDESKPPLHRQEGILPKAFHNSSNRRPRGLDKVLKESATNVIRQQRRQVSTQLKLKRAAFKEVTSLKTWPLQELALQDLDHWCMVHLGKHQTKNIDNIDTTDVETHGDSTGLSSSSLEEPKRARRKDSDDEEDLSPRKSTMRHQFKQDFMRERDLEFLDESNSLPALWCMEPRIFAVEKSATGKRKYIVGHLGRFLDYYWRKCDLKQRHYYELIREKTPCRLYFDLEFSKVSNPDITEEETQLLLEEFMEELIDEFKNIYSIDLRKDAIVDLDSSTEKKFSSHWIVHLPRGELFADATAAGRFIRVFVGRLADEIATGQMERSMLAKYLFVNAPSSKRSDNTSEEITAKSCFVDLGVYTRNRLFRIMGSCKFGKPASAALHLASTNQFPFPIGDESFYVPALLEKDNKKANEELGDDMKRDMQNFESAVDWTNHAEALAATLVVPMNVLKCNFPILQDSEAAKAFAETEGAGLSSASVAGVVTTRSTNTAVKTGRSTFPCLDKFVLNKLAIRGGVQGTIRGWSLENDGKMPKSITYQMVRNRWCESIGRPHKSNNIMWTIDFTAMDVTQGCHDPDCRAMRFRGTPKPLPEAVQEELRDALFDYELMAHVDEAELMKKNSPTSQSEFDDEEFERALLALTINGDTTPTKSNTSHPQLIHETTAPSPSLATLDDDALWKAAELNPELFP